MDAFIVWDIDMLATLAQISDFEGVKVGFTLSNAQQIVRLARKDSLEDIRLLHQEPIGRRYKFVLICQL